MTETVSSRQSPYRQRSAGICCTATRSRRLALSVSNQPEIFPINYVVQDGTLLFRTAPGTKLAALTVNEAVAVEIDGHDDVGGWSVVVKGRRTPPNGASTSRRRRSPGLRPWVATHKPVFVRVQAVGDHRTARSSSARSRATC